jgi:hypothetical protein
MRTPHAVVTVPGPAKRKAIEAALFLDTGSAPARY